MKRRLIWLLLATLLPTFTALAQDAAPVAPELLEESDSSSAMSWWQALVLGVVEGLTEYLPISSTGHLKLAQAAMGLGTDEASKVAADAYAICIQAGAILAVVGLYGGHIRRMLAGLVGRDPEGLTLLVNLAVAFLPAAAVGLLFDDLIKHYLFGLWPIVTAWFFGGVALLVAERLLTGSREPDLLELYRMRWRQALLIGCMQCLAVWPGTSRSLATILGGRFAGLSLANAVVFSFLLGAITLTAATAYDTLKHGSDMLAHYRISSMALGVFSAWISALFAVRWMVTYLQRHDMKLFAWYRMGLAVVVAAILLVT